jgi:hypothetical protein
MRMRVSHVGDAPTTVEVLTRHSNFRILLLRTDREASDVELV